MNTLDLATALDRAERSASPFTPRARDAELTVSAAWEVAGVRDRLRARSGATPVGYKLGWTSEQMRAAYGISESNHGRLFDYMDLSAHRKVCLDALIDPLVEPEIAFRTTERLSARSDAATILRGGEWAVALEVVDPRWRRPFTWLENTADGSSAAGFAVGEWRYRDEDPATEVVWMSTSLGRRVGRGENAMGSPVAAVAWLLASLERRGGELRPGEVVLTGGLTQPMPLAVGDRIEVASNGLGTCHLDVTGEERHHDCSI